MRRLVALVCVGALIAGACGDDDAEPAASPTTVTLPEQPTTTVAPPASTAAPSTASTSTSTTTTVAAEPTDGCVAEPTESRTMIDPTRPTPATAQSDELPSRSIEVLIDRPTASGPWPLIVFAHGLTGHARAHEMHRRDLAAACFVVIAPVFPLTNNDVPDAWSNAGDVTGQIGDVSFLIDEALADADLAAVVDPERIGVIGHSLGGLTTAGAVVSPGSDERVSAAVVMSAGFAQAREGVAVMILHGDADSLVPIDIGSGAYDVLAGRAVFVTLLGGDHVAGIIDDESDYGSVVRGITAAFFARELDNGPGPVDELSELPLDLASIEARTADGPLDQWIDYFAA